ncbi:MAG TPA: R3H domain-containing nucleic acid-binding protein, partial [Dehalococcoidia bacterium]|nr:R3H domain-containing nucleic acid-binding protein [Dehalococcoidia bacterium]
MQRAIIDDLDALLDILPSFISEPLHQREDRRELLEVVMDLGRPPEARFFNCEVVLSPKEIEQQDIEYVVSRVSAFGGDNRAGIERTLHRISAIRNRQGRIIGLTCRLGRAVFGTMKLIEDLVESGSNILLLGRPGVGKTTMLREVARVLADELGKRVIIVDTSNEIAGDGDIPHPAIGHARRMQVPTPTMQHAVMIEAVENHMPEAIIIDEIGAELEAAASRTIAERGVQLVGTAHGNTLENLILNPTLSDLIGGIQTVTLGDEEARRRGTRKSILERKAPPTFDVVVEIQNFNRVAVHPNVSEVVDATLRSRLVTREVRWLDEKGEVQREKERVSPFSPVEIAAKRKGEEITPREDKLLKVYPFGVNRAKLEQAAKEKKLVVSIVSTLREANLFLTSKNYYHRKPQQAMDAELAGLPIYVIKSNTLGEMKQFFDSIYADEKRGDTSLALKEAEEAITEVVNGKDSVKLSPQNAYIRRLQHLMVERSHLVSRSLGKEPQRRVEIFR